MRLIRKLDSGSRPNTMAIEIGTTVTCTVVKVTDYGAIARLPEGKTGLIHISEIANNYVRNVRDYFGENDEVTVRVLRQDDRGRYELSVKRCGDGGDGDGERPRQPVATGLRPARQTWSRPAVPSAPARPPSFEEKLSRFMKDSEDRLHDLKQHDEGRRGRR